MEDNYENGWRAATLLIRESCMLKLVDTLSDKSDWWLKVRDPKIANKWKEEALAMDWKLYRQYADFTPAMADAVSWKGPIFRVHAQMLISIVYQRTTKESGLV